MPLDALCLAAAARELQTVLPGCRVDKVQQPERDVLLLTLRGDGEVKRLLVSAGSGTARVHLTAQNRENPAEPPMFCMLLRKHLVGGRLLSVEQPGCERLYILRFACMDELGNAGEKKLVVEMMGRNANLLLLDGGGHILDCLHKLDTLSSPQRPLLPGLYYELPPTQNKKSAFELTEEAFQEDFRQADRADMADRWLVSSYAGVSPLLAREAVVRAAGSCDLRLGELRADALWSAFSGLLSGEAVPVLLSRNGEPADLYCRDIIQYGHAMTKTVYPDFSALLDAFYTEKERYARQQQRSQSLTKLVKTRRERAARKLAARMSELKATEQRETWRQYGDLIKANLYRMKKGEPSLTAENFYDPDYAPVSIPLDVKLSPQQNAAHYYKLYSKAKNAEKILTEQITEAQQELEYLESVQEELERASGERDLAEIRQELISEGYLKDPDKKRKKPATPQPMRFRSDSGALIRVGKNNVQNDWLTLRNAEKNSLWFHAQKTHGSHVIADCTEDDEETVRAAALLAAYYSKGRDGSNVAVDYTRVRYVKKPAGAKPGMVIYTDQKTLYVTPDKDAIAAIRQLK